MDLSELLEICLCNGVARILEWEGSSRVLEAEPLTLGDIYKISKKTHFLHILAAKIVILKR